MNDQTLTLTVSAEEAAIILASLVRARELCNKFAARDPKASGHVRKIETLLAKLQQQLHITASVNRVPA